MMWTTMMRRTGARAAARRRGATTGLATARGLARFRGPPQASLTVAQRRVQEDILRTRTTGLNGPFGPWLANAELAQAAQTLGRIARYETSLSPRESELVILATAQHHRSGTEWDIHVREARRVGLEEPFIATIAGGGTIESPPREAALHKFARQVLETSSASDDAYDAMVREFSETHAVETVAIIGYYGLVAQTLNVFQIPSPHNVDGGGLDS